MLKPELLEDRKEELRHWMSYISEQEWCAGWIRDLEYTLWDRLQKEVDPKKGPVWDGFVMRRIKELAEETGGWWIWDDALIDERFVPMKEWLVIYASRPKGETDVSAN